MYQIREQNLTPQEETPLDYSLIVRMDYRSLTYAELERHVRMLEQYSNNLIDYIVSAEYDLKYKPALHAESHAIVKQLAKAANLYLNFTVAQETK